MAELFCVEVNTINYHIKEVFKSVELQEEATIQKIRIVQYEGKKNREKINRSQYATLEDKVLRSQYATLEDKRGKHRKYLPYVFTEHGAVMLASVLKSDTAIKASIKVVNVFVELRKFVSSNRHLFQRMDIIEYRMLQNEAKVDKVFKALEQDNLKPKQGIFYNGQVFDAYTFVSDLIRSARSSLVLIDNYIDDTVLTIFTKRKRNVTVTIFMNNISKQFVLDLKKHNEQYPSIDVKLLKESHDRFLIIDGKELYHIGASLKDLGKKWFAFSKLETGAIEMLSKLKAKKKKNE